MWACQKTPLSQNPDCSDLFSPTAREAFRSYFMMGCRQFSAPRRMEVKTVIVKYTHCNLNNNTRKKQLPQKYDAAPETLENLTLFMTLGWNKTDNRRP